jgi:hypothetical protein
MDDWSERWLARVTFRPATPDEDRVPFIVDPIAGKLSLSPGTLCAPAHRRSDLLCRPAISHGAAPIWGST